NTRRNNIAQCVNPSSARAVEEVRDCAHRCDGAVRSKFHLDGAIVWLGKGESVNRARAIDGQSGPAIYKQVARVNTVDRLVECDGQFCKKRGDAPLGRGQIGDAWSGTTNPIMLKNDQTRDKERT